jgi:OOP family OmpA-OmpF porin
MNALKYMLTAAAGLALSGCADIRDVNSFRTATPQGGTPFTQALTGEYQALTVDEADNEIKWDDAAYFARKGMRAAKGEAVPPANVAAAPAGASERYGDLGPVVLVSPDRVPDLAAARGRLIAFLDGGGRDLQPVLAAHAQGLYDCWLEEAWETDDADSSCRTDFLALILQNKVVQTTTVTKPPVAQQKMNIFQVFFDFDRSDISDGAARILQQAAASAKQGKVTGIKLTGHTDSSGSVAYNQALSERRAEAVKEELIRDGLSAAEITSLGVGKSGQLLATPDGVREPQNRRTEIILQ